MQVKQNEIKVLKEVSNLKADKSKIFMNLKKLKPEVHFYFAVQDDDGVVLNNVKEFILTTKKIKISLTGEDLKNLGIKQGPVYREILDKLLQEKIDGKIKTREQEIDFVKKYL
jgi:tRNA nucleotidyltransferase (CCA-adding enzyme)